ncbi:MAG: T9SS type A sorting domain-containing protein [Saprospiraceae bacterium]|nr:T9SS type A sorting domain-containing protein [Saprospiraceae bacterium]
MKKIPTTFKFILAPVGLIALVVGLIHFGGSLFPNPLPETGSMEQEGRLTRTIKGRFEQEFLMTRDPATNSIPRDRLLAAYHIAQEKRAQMAQTETAIPIYWQERGPDNVGGRTRGLLIDANDATGRTVWAAGVSGGLWHTTNIDAGTPTWVESDDFFENLNITTMAQDPSTPALMYFGTGEQGFANGIERGLGIWNSSDGGANWDFLPFTFGNGDFNNVNKIVVDNNGDIYAGTGTGIFRSTDGGGNFLRSLPNVGNAQDVEVAANGDIYASLRTAGIFRFRNNNWATLTSPNFPASFNRIEMACAPGNGNVVYAAFEAADGSCAAVCVSTDGGNNWVQTASTPSVGTISWYCFILAIDPNNTNRVWLGAQSLVHSNDGGASWVGYGAVHADHHAIVYQAGNSNNMVFGNDGGIYRSTNGAAGAPSLTPKNKTYNVTQFYANALHPTAGSNYILGGTQDNGTRRFNGAGLNDTDEPTGNDGAFCFIDQDNPNIQITGSQTRWFFQSTNGGASFSEFLAATAQTTHLFITPADYDDAANILYYSDVTNSLGRVSNFGGALNFTTETITGFGGGQASAISVSPNTANRVFVGTTNGNLVRIDNAHQNGMITVTDLNSPISNYISCIAIEDGNDNHIIVTQSNYGTNSVWETTNGGGNWVDLDNDLPDLPVRWAMFHPFDADKVVLATELGVWSTDDLNGVNTEWWPTNNFGLANVRVDMLQYRSSDHLVAAATHGRGMYTTDYFSLLNTCVPSLNVAGAVLPGIYMAEDFITSNGVIAPKDKVIYHAGQYIQLNPGFHAKRGSDFWALIEQCGMPPIVGDRPDDRRYTGSQIPYPNQDRLKTDLERPELESLALRCYPNPTNYRLFVEYDLPADGTFSLYIRDLQGRLMETFALQTKRAAGRYQVELNAAEYHGGIYVITLQTSENAVSERFVVVK